MYINDIHILYYLCYGIIGMIIGQVIDFFNIRLSKNEKDFSRNFLSIYLKNIKPKYTLMFINAILYIVIIFLYGISDIRTYEYLIITPILICAICISYKTQKISNRLVLTLFEIVLIFTFIQGIANLNILIDKVLGFITGIVIFLITMVISKIISLRDKVDISDIKIFSVLGLLFGFRSIIGISIMSFICATIVSVILILTKKRNINENISFGPFFLASSLFMLFIPVEKVIMLLLNFGNYFKV